MYLWVDGTALLARCTLQLRHLHAPDGRPTGGVWGTCRHLFTQIARWQPAACAVALDLPAPTFRHRLDPSYKRRRGSWTPAFRQQVADLMVLLSALGIPVVRAAGFEADDCIATLVACLPPASTRIVTGDHDLLALVSELVTVEFAPSGVPLKHAIAVTPDWVQHEYGVLPAQLPDLRVLIGDPGDDVPGVEGIGPATARRLLRESGSVEGILGALASGKVEPDLAAQLQPAHLRRFLQILRLRTNVPLAVSPESYRLRSPAPDLAALCLRFGFKSWLDRRPWTAWAAG